MPAVFISFTPKYSYPVDISCFHKLHTEVMSFCLCLLFSYVALRSTLVLLMYPVFISCTPKKCHPVGSLLFSYASHRSTVIQLDVSSLHMLHTELLSSCWLSSLFISFTPKYCHHVNACCFHMLHTEVQSSCLCLLISYAALRSTLIPLMSPVFISCTP